MKTLKIIFMGTPEFAATSLIAITKSDFYQRDFHKIVAVYTKEPKPAGRGNKLQKSPCQEFAESQGIPVETPKNFRSAETIEKLKSYQADIIIVCAYGIILPQAVLDATPPLGCVNIHGSLLPRWRGAAPIQRAIEAGDKETGITIMQMDAGLDTGDMLSKHPMKIYSNYTAGILHDKMALEGAEAIIDFLRKISAGEKIAGEKQDNSSVPEQFRYAKKITKEEAKIDFSEDAETIVRKIRAFNPFPKAYFTINGQNIKVLEAEATNGHVGVIQDDPTNYGRILDYRLIVCKNNQMLQLIQIQPEGKRPMTPHEFHCGNPIIIGGAGVDND